MFQNKIKCKKCGGNLNNNKCLYCGIDYHDNIDNFIIIGNCSRCGAEGRQIEARGANMFLCLSCFVLPTREGERLGRQDLLYKTREETMYWKAKYFYLDNPKFLGRPINDRVVAIAHDRYLSKKYPKFRPINPELWGSLPPDIL